MEVRKNLTWIIILHQKLSISNFIPFEHILILPILGFNNNVITHEFGIFGLTLVKDFVLY